MTGVQTCALPICEEKIYLSSADWMERNFFRRIEVCFPVLEPKLKQRVFKEGLKPYLADNAQAWEMDGNGDYRVKPTKRARVSAQERLLAEMGVSAVSVT